MTSYPPSTLTYPLLNQLLDSSLPFPVSSTSSTFTLPTVATTSSSFPISSSSASPTVVSVISSNVASVTSDVSLPPISSFVHTTASNTSASTISPVLSSISSPVSSIESPFFLHPKDAVATSPHFQQYSAVRQLTRDVQQKKPKHPRRPSLPSDVIGKPIRRLVHTVFYKQKLNQYIDALKLYEKHIDELIEQTTFELNKINNKPLPSKLRKLKTPQPIQLSPLSIQIPSHNCYNHYNCFSYNTPHCSHVPVNYAIHSHFPPPPLSPALIPICIEAITPTF